MSKKKTNREEEEKKKIVDNNFSFERDALKNEMEHIQKERMKEDEVFFLSISAI